jgi:diketogulonate reductase-like aldo/keto reductase
MVLAWHLGVGNIVIPKSMHAERMRENLAAAGITLSADELEAVGSMDSAARIGPDPATAAFTQM